MSVLSFFSRRRSVRPPTPRRAVPFLETLERRDCPSGPSSLSALATVSPTLTLNLTPGTLANVTVSGDLSNTDVVANQTIQITGAVPGTATTDANGHYSAILQATGVGQVNAQTVDHSALASATLSVAAPTFNGTQGNSTFTWKACNGLWTFIGTVSAPNLGNITSITIDNGQTLQNTPVDLSDHFSTTTGNFSLNVRLTMPRDAGWVTATVKDCWGQTAEADTYVM